MPLSTDPVSSPASRAPSLGGPGGRSALNAIGAIAADIKLAHSVFALPFALLAACMAARPIGSGGVAWTRFAGQVVLVILAMVFARTAAMIANRLLDWTIDRDNPRTAGRAIPSGRLSLRAAMTAFVVAGGAFVAVCAAFGMAFENWWPLALALPVLAWICAYGLLKRFTVLCHLYLGASLAISPLAAALAVDPAQIGQRSIWLLAAMVLCWVAGFDVIYALQDVEADRRQGLHSLPSRWGVPAAMWASRLLHALAAASLWWIALGDPRFGAPMVVAASIVTVLLVVEHATVARWGTTRMALSFFTLNGVIACVVGALGAWDVVGSAKQFTTEDTEGHGDGTEVRSSGTHGV